ncbi:hypothetical protein [Myceligenerans cantabricum]
MTSTAPPPPTTCRRPAGPGPDGTPGRVTDGPVLPGSRVREERSR